VVVEGLAHLSRNVTLHAASVYWGRHTSLIRDRVDIFVSDGTSAAGSGIIYYHRLGLKSADHRIQLVFLPIGVPFAPISVKPESAYLTVIGAEPLYALTQVFEIPIEIRFKIGMMPIECGVVKEGDNIRVSAFFNEFGDQISFCG
jgi:hypothetical protein